MKAFKSETKAALVSSGGDGHGGDIIPGNRPVQMEISLSKLFINMVEVPYQRDPASRTEWLKRNIVKNFAIENTGEFYVSERPGDRYAIMDGGGRYYVMTQMLPQWHDAIVYCLVWKNLTIEQEAAIYASQRNRKSISPVDYFKADVVRKKPEAVELQKVMNDIGFKVGATWPRGVSSVPYLYGLYRIGMLGRTLLILRNSTNKSSRVNGVAIAAVAVFLHAAGRSLQEDRFRKMIINKGGPIWFEEQVKLNYKGIRVHPNQHVGVLARLIGETYNAGMKRDRVPLPNIEKSAAYFMSKYTNQDRPRSG